MDRHTDGAAVKAAIGAAAREQRQADGDYGRLCLLDGTDLRAATRKEHERAAQAAVDTLDPEAPIRVNGKDCRVVER